MNQEVDNHGRGHMQRRASGITMVKSFVGAVARTGVAISYGQRPFVPDNIFADRLNICKTCKNFDAKRMRCNLCGCFANLKLKLATEQCPLNPPKWGKYAA